jgi:hypothetical protein
MASRSPRPRRALPPSVELRWWSVRWPVALAWAAFWITVAFYGLPAVAWLVSRFLF